MAGAKKLRVALLMGGNSSEREVSLNSGKSVLKALNPKKYQVTIYDPPADLPKLVKDAARIDVAVVMLHGRGGEDGALQGLLDWLGVPYQCSGVMGCAMAMNKTRSKALFRQAGLPVATDVLVLRGQANPEKKILAGIDLPVILKPANEGSSVGITIVRRAEDLGPALELAFKYDEEVLAETYLDGVEVTAGILGNRELTALPLIEIIPTEKYAFFDYDAKYLPGASNEICPARLGEEMTAQIQELAKQAHLCLGLTGYSRADFILTEQGPVLLEVNTIPGMTATSLLPQAAAKAGLDFPALMDRLIELALERR